MNTGESPMGALNQVREKSGCPSQHRVAELREGASVGTVKSS